MQASVIDSAVFCDIFGTEAMRRVWSDENRTTYGLMFVLPLVGWGMLSAARYPIVLYGSLQLPPILPHDAALYAVLRTTHTVLAFLLFATFLAHFAAALTHALIYRDGVFPSMASWKT